MTLIWDAQLLGVDYADEVRLTAVTASRPLPLKSERVDFAEERITLEELEANTRYEVFVDLVRDEGITEAYRGFIKTPPTGKLASVIMVCINAPKYDMVVYKKNILTHDPTFPFHSWHDVNEWALDGRVRGNCPLLDSLA